jgi:hypothetical protein
LKLLEIKVLPEAIKAEVMLSQAKALMGLPLKVNVSSSPKSGSSQF